MCFSDTAPFKTWHEGESQNTLVHHQIYLKLKSKPPPFSSNYLINAIVDESPLGTIFTTRELHWAIILSAVPLLCVEVWDPQTGCWGVSSFPGERERVLVLLFNHPETLNDLGRVFRNLMNYAVHVNVLETSFPMQGRVINTVIISRAYKIFHTQLHLIFLNPCVYTEHI